MAAAAYAALVSLCHVLHQILNPPPRHDFIFDRETLESLLDHATSLIHLLETYPGRCSLDMEERIVSAVHDAEDILESYVVQRTLARYAIRPQLKKLSRLWRSLRVGIGELIPIQKVSRNRAILQIIQIFIRVQSHFDEIKNRECMEYVAPEISTRSTPSSTALPSGRDIMVGFEEHLDRVRSVLASDRSKLVILPIVGMGGIGKTTLASNVYIDPYITEKFAFRAWVSVSQEYKHRDIVIALLHQITSKIDGRNVGSKTDGENELSAEDLGVLLYRKLFGRRYLIVLDDMWEIQAWDRLRNYLPDNNKNSRILVTLRNVDLAEKIGSGNTHQMSLLDDDKSWALIHEYVKEDCPIELEKIGRSIARGCRGLPLALVVIGGLLAQSEKSIDFWMRVEQNVTSTANYANDEQCLNVLRLSYSQLPMHLKPCFLYLAVFPKSFEIHKSRLIRLWIAEGFIKPSKGRSLEEVAEDSVKNLYDRNLVMISRRGDSGKVKNYKLHDVVRELCVAEAQKNKFVCIANLDNHKTLPRLVSERRLSIHSGTGNDKGIIIQARNRSLLSHSSWKSRRHVAGRLKLLRVLDVADSYSLDEILWLINSRYLTCTIPRDSNVTYSFSLLWNLQTLVLSGPISLPPQFWRMPQLRHLKIPGITLPRPSADQSLVVLENLQTLKTVKDFVFCQNVVRRIPHLKKLGVDCRTTERIISFGLSNLASFDKLECLFLKSREPWENMAFPSSLKKLTLSHCQIPWKDMSIVGSLENLQVLKLLNRAATGKVWTPNEDEFCRLKFLLIDWCELEIWEPCPSNYPILEHLQLVRVRMEVFPPEFSEIETLHTIDLNYCSKALLSSAKDMSRERRDNDYSDVQIRSFPPQASRSREHHVVGLEDEMEKLIGYLSEECEELDVISIVGEGGLGKTTLAKKIFHDPVIFRMFYIRIWITVSENLCERNLFLSILREFTTLTEEIYHKSDEELANLTWFFLDGIKFLLVLDDLWAPED